MNNYLQGKRDTRERRLRVRHNQSEVDDILQRARFSASTSSQLQWPLLNGLEFLQGDLIRFSPVDNRIRSIVTHEFRALLHRSGIRKFGYGLRPPDESEQRVEWEKRFLRNPFNRTWSIDSLRNSRGIYLILHRTGYAYVGITGQPLWKRLQQHFTAARNKRGQSSDLLYRFMW